MQANLIIIFDTPKFCLPQLTIKMDLCKYKITKKSISLTGFWWENALIFFKMSQMY